MRFFFTVFLLCFLCTPISSFASEIEWQGPMQIDNLGYFAKNPPEDYSLLDYGYYERMTRTFVVAKVVENGKNI